MNMLLPMLLVSLVVSACASAAPLPKESDPRLFIAGPVRPDIQVATFRDEVLPDGNLQVLLTGHSLGESPLHLRYRAIWLDAAGMPIDTVVSSWNHTTLESERPFELKLTGPTRKAVTYRIEIEEE